MSILISCKFLFILSAMQLSEPKPSKSSNSDMNLIVTAIVNSTLKKSIMPDRFLLKYFERKQISAGFQ